MKYLNTYSESRLNFKVIENPSLYKIYMFDGDIELGYSLVTIKNNVFSRWNFENDDITEYITDDKCLYIIGISVNNKKDGYGSKLVKYIEDFAKNKECKYVTLGSITDALGFWKKIGYKIYSSSFVHYMYKKIK